MPYIFYLSSNQDKASKIRLNLPEDLYLPLNMGRSLARNNTFPNSWGKNERDNYSVSIVKWLEDKFSSNFFTILGSSIVTTEVFTIGGVIYPVNTNIQVIINALVNNASNTDKHYVHTQALADTTWNITHNLDKYPSVTIVDSSGNQVLADITFIDLDNISINFSSSMDGKAYLN